MRSALPNPAWSNCALLRFWDAIEAHVGPRAMPKVTKHTVNALEAVEYGAGSYGVVLPTAGARGVVCKITSDPSEAHFVSVYHRLGRRPEGLVKYGPIFELPAKHGGRKMFILWREEAFDVGKVFGSSQDDRVALSIVNAIFDETISTCKVACSPRASRRDLDAIRESARESTGHTGYENGKTPGFISRVASRLTSSTSRAGRGFAAAHELAEELASIPKYRAIGRAMLELMKQGVLVTDTHDGNFGYVKRGGKKIAAITDPGNVAFLTTKFDSTWPKRVTDGLPASLKEQLAAQPVRCAR